MKFQAPLNVHGMSLRGEIFKELFVFNPLIKNQ